MEQGRVATTCGRDDAQLVERSGGKGSEASRSGAKRWPSELLVALAWAEGLLLLLLLLRLLQ